jgi:hypothetical protein
MLKNDDFIDTVVFSLKYAFSNMGSLLIGGIVLTLSLLLLGLPFFLGYITKCIREILRGNGVLPEWDNIGEIFIDGIKMTAVFIVYAILFVLISIIPAVPAIAFQVMKVGYLSVISLAILSLTLAIVSMVFGVIFFLSWMIYAMTGSIKSAITPKNIIDIISKNPHGFVIVMLATVVMVVLGGISMSLFITIPWAIFTVSTSITFIYSKFYQNTTKDVHA